MTSIAIIGAGMSGLAAAHTLQHHLPDASIHVFEKSRGVGRMATRYNAAFQFDFGAPHFRVKTPEFEQFLAPFSEAGVVKSWQPTRYVVSSQGNAPAHNDFPYYHAYPKMTSLGRAIVAQLDACDVHYKTRVHNCVKTDTQWQLISEDNTELGRFDWVICTAPTAQAVDILPRDFAHFDDVMQCKIDACFTLMLGWSMPEAPETLTQADWALLEVDLPNSPIEKCVLEQAKHAQDAVSLTVFSRNDWAEVQVDADADNAQAAVKQQLMQAVDTVLGINTQTAQQIDMHRWRYAKPRTVGESACLMDAKQRMIAAGDWCLQGSVESAFLSGQAAAHAIVNAVTHI